MPKDTKSFNKRATLALRVLLVAITCLVVAGIYAAVTDEPVNKPQPTEELKNEEAQGTPVNHLPAAGKLVATAGGDVAEPAVDSTACLLIKAEGGDVPAVLHTENTIRIPARLCMSFILGITEALNQDLVKAEDLLYEPSM